MPPRSNPRYPIANLVHHAPKSRPRRSWVFALLPAFMITLVGCQTAPPAPAIDQQVGTNGHRFEHRMTPDGRTSQADIRRLMRTLDTAYEALDFQAPYPRIEIVHGRRVNRKTLASASVDIDGVERIVIRREHVRSERELLPLLVHELSHLQAWRRHGTTIAVHGREFWQICRVAAKAEACAAAG